MKAANTEDAMFRIVSRSPPELGWRVPMARCPGDRALSCPAPTTDWRTQGATRLADSGQFLSFPAQLSPSTTYRL